MEIEERIARGRRVGPALDLHGQRQTNASDAKDSLDLVTLRQLRDELKGLSVGSGTGTQVTTNVTNNNTYNGTGPFYDNGSVGGGVTTIDKANGFKHKCTLTGDQFFSFSGFTDGDECLLWITDTAGGHLIGWTFPADGISSMPDAAGAQLYVNFVHNGTGMVEIYATSRT